MLFDAQSGARFSPLQAIPQAKASFEICNSPLTENAVIGFEYGYDIQAPDRLVIWEAQYGDFINGAQLMLDEFVLSARSAKREHGVTALDVAKRLMDHGIHPPTIYFPLVVPEALMIEPTETETKERLDEFVDAMRSIAAEAASEPETLKAAPLTRPVRRLDEVKAAKEPVVRHAFDTPPAAARIEAG